MHASHASSTLNGNSASAQAERRRELRDLLTELTTNELTAFTQEHIFKRLTQGQKRTLLNSLQQQLPQ